ncbi:MAG: tetratricopeptide repeat protein, partial [Myxococcota bacterium]
KADYLSDPSGAKATLEQALELVPDHPTALATLAKIVEEEEDPRTYAEARLREAEALDDVDTKVEALMKAGLALRDRCQDIAGARAAFEDVLRLRPYHSDATWALAGLVEQGGDLDQASQVLKKRLEDETLDRAEKARLMTQLAALARQAGVDAAAERYLIEALDDQPDHLPAIIARADLLSESERWDDLAAFLAGVLPAVAEAPSATQAELHRRLAMAYEKLGRDDEAYQTLLGADRLHRGHLLVKLALGENRYRARRWREAAMHLGSLAMHVDARKHPAEVAEGLYHAALAEIRTLRPDKARALYERAIDLKPNFTPALHALAELAMELGDYAKAADLLTRQAMATDEPSERLRLFEALGDMASDTLGDGERARVCYEAAVGAASPLESKHLPLLGKLCDLQTQASDHRAAARTAELMATFGSDAQSRAERFAAAADHYFAVGDEERGMAAARRAVEADPDDLMAVNVLSERLVESGLYEDAAAVLGRALSGGGNDDDEYVAARKAQLWNRLAHARKARGDAQGAATAWEKSVAIASDSDGAMDSRRQLLQAWKDDPDKVEQLLEFRRILAADTLSLADVVNYARALQKAKNDDGGRAILELAALMGHKLDKFDQAFLDRRPVYEMAADEAYRGQLSAQQRAELIENRGPDEEDEDDVLARLLTTLWHEAAALLWPEIDEQLERCGVYSAERIQAVSGLAAASMFPRIATALDVPATVLYQRSASAAPDVQVVCLPAPIVVFGPRLHVRQTIQPSHDEIGDGAIAEAEMRFILARAAELVRPEHVIATGLSRSDLGNLLASLVRSFGPKRLHDLALGDIHDEDVQRAHDDNLRSTLPVKLRQQLEKILADASARDLDPDSYLDRIELRADRAGLLMCGDIATAMTQCGRSSESGERQAGRHLFASVLASGYLKARATLGVGVRS